MNKPFGMRLKEAMEKYGPLCAGIDPHPSLLNDWGLSDDVAGLREFTNRCLEAFLGNVAAIKPQSAFYERHGSAGLAVLEDALRVSKESDTQSILDVKRGDIGSTMAGYAQAFLAPTSPFEADAITLSPYLGFDSLAPAYDLARENGKGIFVLCLTSNPEGASVQHAQTPTGNSVAAEVAAGAAKFNQEHTPAGQMGSLGLVVGATVGDSVREQRVNLPAVNGPFLAPGLGAQGGSIAQVKAIFTSALPNVLASSSRGILGFGPKIEDLKAAAIKESKALQNSLV